MEKFKVVERVTIYGQIFGKFFKPNILYDKTLFETEEPLIMEEYLKKYFPDWSENLKIDFDCGGYGSICAMYQSRSDVIVRDVCHNWTTTEILLIIPRTRAE